MSEEQTNRQTEGDDLASGGNASIASPPASIGNDRVAGHIEKAEESGKSEKAEKVVKVRMLGPRKLTKEQMETPEPRSPWPFALAMAILVACIGLLIHPIIFFIGVALILGSITGWLLERRSYLR